MVTLVLGVFHATERRIARFTLLAAAGVYLAAPFFRTIDNESVFSYRLVPTSYGTF
jgi:hypothetical protein